MTLDPQEQKTTVEERAKELFETMSDSFNFCCLISWNYLFSLKSKNVFMIGEQILFTYFYTSLVQVWIFSWGILTPPLRCRSSWNVLLVSLYTVLNSNL